MYSLWRVARSFTRRPRQASHCLQYAALLSTSALVTAKGQEVGSLSESCHSSKPLIVSAMRYLSQAEAIAVDEELMRTPGFSIDQLMELAGLSCAGAIADAFPIPDTKSSASGAAVLVVAGPGNNGGDGLVAARHLCQFGYEVTVVYPKRNTRNPLFVNLVQQVSDVNIEILDALPPDVDKFDVVVDAIFGFSFKPPLREPFGEVLAQLAEIPQSKLASIDIPSGWDVENGASEDGPTLKPDVLISLTWPKKGVEKWSGRRHYLGGRFVPPGIASKYSIDTGGYPGSAQFRLLESGPSKAVEAVVVVWITVPVAEADDLTKGIISNKLAACVNKISAVQSTYMWEGKVESDTESLLMVKTTVTKLPVLTDFVEKTHSYDVPETIAAQIVGGNAAYLKWVASSVE